MALDYEGLDLSDDVKAALDAQAGKLTEGFVAAEEFNKLKSNRDELLGEKKSAQAKAEEAAREANQAKLDAAAKNNDVESLNASWQSKHDTLQADYDGLVKANAQSSLNDVAQGFVDDHGLKDDVFSREALKGEFAKRLDRREGQTVVLDAAGNLTAMTVEDLKSEFLGTSKYKPHLLASKANGSGAAGGQNGNVGSASAPKTLAECKGDKAKEIAYFDSVRANQI